jgi:hypothetical protein
VRLIGDPRSMQRQQKITLGEMREFGPIRLIVYCGDYKCAHSVVVDASRWGDDVRLPTWSRDLRVRFAAIGLPTSGRCSSTRTWGPVSDATDRATSPLPRTPRDASKFIGTTCAVTA